MLFRSLLDTRRCSVVLLSSWLGGLGLLLKLGDLEAGWLGELEVDGVGGKLGVGVGAGIKTSLHQVLVHWVQEDLLDLATLHGGTDLTAGHTGWHADVVKDGFVHGLEGTGAWSLLGSVGDGSGGDDGSVGNHNNWLLEHTLEVLNHLTGNLAPGQEGSEWDSDQDVSLLSTSGGLVAQLLGRVDVDKSEVLLESWGGALLKVLQVLGDLLLKLAWLLAFLDRKSTRLNSSH